MEPFEQEYEGKQYTLCPWYPKTNWRALSIPVVTGVKELLDIQEQVISCPRILTGQSRNQRWTSNAKTQRRKDAKQLEKSSRALRLCGS